MAMDGKPKVPSLALGKAPTSEPVEDRSAMDMSSPREGYTSKEDSDPEAGSKTASNRSFKLRGG